MKCSCLCKFYDAYVSSEEIKVVCLIKESEIKNVPKPIRDNCIKFYKKER